MRTWAEIYVDGALMKRAPATLKLSAGKHAIRVANDDQSESINVDIQPNETTKLDYDM